MALLGASECSLRVVERIKEDICEQVAELVCDYVILLRRDKLNKCFAAGLHNDHADVVTNYKHFVTLLDSFVSLAKYLLS